MIIFRKGEERKGYRVLIVKISRFNETKFAVQEKVKFLLFFNKWKFITDKSGEVRLFDSNKNASAYINFKRRWKA
jgi:hypothetical protein